MNMCRHEKEDLELVHQCHGCGDILPVDEKDKDARIRDLEKWLRDIFTAYHQFETDGFTEVLMNIYREFVDEE